MKQKFHKKSRTKKMAQFWNCPMLGLGSPVVNKSVSKQV